MSVAFLSLPVLIFSGMSMLIAVALYLLAPGSLCFFGALQNVVSMSGEMASVEGVMVVRLKLVQLADWVSTASWRIDEIAAMKTCV